MKFASLNSEAYVLGKGVLYIALASWTNKQNISQRVQHVACVGSSHP